MKKFTPPGYTLVEIAIVLAIIGVLLAGGTRMLRSTWNQVRYQTTQDRLTGIGRALAEYAQKNYHLPCAADPAATGVNLGVGAATCPYTGAFTVGETIGIIPYKDLGMRQEQVLDGYGNYITYVLNPAYGTDAQANANANSACRVAGLWIDTTLLPLPKNKNPRKAKFCCAVGLPSPGVEIRVFSDASNANSMTPSRASIFESAPVDIAYNPALYGKIAPASLSPTYETQTPAFLLISHGENKFGAFIVDGTQSRINGGFSASRISEIKNQTNFNSEFYMPPYNKSNVGPDGMFDDILYWQTPSQLLSASGLDSCSRP